MAPWSKLILSGSCIPRWHACSPSICRLTASDGKNREDREEGHSQLPRRTLMAAERSHAAFTEILRWGFPAISFQVVSYFLQTLFNPCWVSDLQRSLYHSAAWHYKAAMASTPSGQEERQSGPSMLAFISCSPEMGDYCTCPQVLRLLTGRYGPTMSSNRGSWIFPKSGTARFRSSESELLALDLATLDLTNFLSWVNG